MISRDELDDRPADPPTESIGNSATDGPTVVWLGISRWAQAHTVSLAAQSLMQADIQQRLQEMWLRSTLGWSLSVLRQQMAPWVALWKAAPTRVRSVQDLSNGARAIGSSATAAADADVYHGP